MASEKVITCESVKILKALPSSLAKYPTTKDKKAKNINRISPGLALPPRVRFGHTPVGSIREKYVTSIGISRTTNNKLGPIVPRATRSGTRTVNAKMVLDVPPRVKYLLHCHGICTNI